MDEIILLLMSYLLTFIFSLLLVSAITIPLNSFADGQITINEFLPHPSSGNKEWVELYVPDGTSLIGYWIDDDTDFNNDAGSSAKKQITSVMQGSDTQHVVFELSSSMFNNDGDTVALFAPDGTLVDQYTYIKDPGVDISIGRTPDGNGDFQVLASATEGSPNSSPKPTDTPTPAPTDKPTKEPKPTDTPKPVKIQTATATVTQAKSSTANQSILADSTINANVKNTFSPPIKTGSSGAHPTSILQTYKQVKRAVTKYPPKSVLVKGVSSSLPQLIAVIIGGLLFVACGILLYWKKRKNTLTG